MHKKRIAYLFGYLAEFFVALVLLLSFHRILKHRYKTKFGEIDLITVRHNTIFFIEVKARRSSGNALNLLSHSQKKRIKKTAAYFLQRYKKDKALFILYHVSFFSISKYYF